MENSGIRTRQILINSDGGGSHVHSNMEEGARESS